MSRDGGLLSAFQPKCQGNKIEKSYVQQEPVVLGSTRPIFFGVCVENVGQKPDDMICRPASAQVNGIVTAPLSDGPADDWRYHQVVYVTAGADGSYSFTQADHGNSIKVGYLLDVHSGGTLVRVQLDRTLQY